MAPKFALFTKELKLPLNKDFKNMFELLQSCDQPSIWRLWFPYRSAYVLLSGEMCFVLLTFPGYLNFIVCNNAHFSRNAKNG